MHLKKFRSLPSELRFSEPKAAGEKPVAELVEILRTGAFKHPEYGPFEITREHVLSFVENHKKKVRGIDIAVDFSHNSDGVAAGWVEEILFQENEKGGLSLMGRVGWTPTALESITNKEFRYLSGDFTLDYVGEEDGKHFGPTLLGAGLTNRPFIKGMDPVVTLSERKEGENSMMNDQEKKELQDAKDLAKKLADEKAAAELKLSEASTKLSEQAKKDEKAAADAKLAEKKGKFDKMLSEKKVVEAQREAFMSGDSEKFMELAVAPPKETKLSESGDPVIDPKEGEKDAEDEIIEKAEKLLSEKKATDIGEAQRMVLADPSNKKLKDSYHAKFK